MEYCQMKPNPCGWIFCVGIVLWLSTGDQPLLSAPHEHGHEHGGDRHGPHGGDLIELGKEEYHAELVHDDRNGVVGIYLLDSAAKRGVAIPLAEVNLNILVNAKPTQFKLPANPVQGDPAGYASCFAVRDPALCRLISESAELHGRLTVAIGGKQYLGRIHHHSHAGHSHAGHAH